MKGNYAYTATKAKARKASLIPHSEYSKMLMMGVPEIIRYISEAGYAEHVEKYTGRYSGVTLIEYATYSSMAEDFQEFLKVAQGELYDIVYTYLGRWDVWNIKTLIRGLSYGASKEEILEDVVPGGALTMRDISAAASKGEVIAALESLPKNIYVKAALSELQMDSSSLLTVENSLDRKYYSHMGRVSTSTMWISFKMRAFLSEEIDLVNIRTLLKTKKDGVEADMVQRFFIPGGRYISLQKFSTLAKSNDLAALIDDMKDLPPYYEVLSQRLDQALSKSSLAPLMNALDRMHLHRSEMFGRIYPLSPLPVLDYILHKKTEVDTIRIISRCKDRGFSIETIKSLLVWGR